MDRPPHKVAVVEDDPSMCRSVLRLLTAHGISTETYPSAEAFLGRLSGGRIDCYVLDIQLGGMSGIELRRQLGGDEVSVIFITAVDDAAIEKEAIEAGSIAYLRKPFAAESLIAAIDSALAKSQEKSARVGPIR